MKKRIMVVDDEQQIRRALARFLESSGYEVDQAADGAEAIELTKHKIHDLVISDLKMPSMSGIDLMKCLKKIRSNTSFLIMTGHGTIESAIEAIKAGAFHYITKPFELADIALLIDKALKYQALKSENEILKQQVIKNFKLENFIGCSDKIQDVFDTIKRVADTDSNILILGESGTGKELVAKGIHYNSKRSERPFIPVNCGAIPENLLESELFGHVKGAFTGAVQSKKGKFEQANGGTIFLDEIGDMGLKLQVKLLRVLQERKFEPVGSLQTIESDIRIIAATHRDLESMVRKGTFREDLYYRLNVIPIVMPPLRERISDIPLLIEHFIEKVCEANKCQRPILSEQIMKVLLNYNWPGNVRELENTVERLAVLRPGQEVKKEDLPEKITQQSHSFFSKGSLFIPEQGLSLKRVVDDFENTLILKALEKTNWNKNRAANLLKLNRTTLVEKIKKKKISRKVVPVQPRLMG